MDEIVKLFGTIVLLLVAIFAVHRSSTLHTVLGALALVLISAYVVIYVY